jgi:putative transposase
MLAQLGDYAWSSYQANAHDKTDELVTAHLLYRRLARHEDERLAAYCALFNVPMDKQVMETIRDSTHKG